MGQARLLPLVYMLVCPEGIKFLSEDKLLRQLMESFFEVEHVSFGTVPFYIRLIHVRTQVAQPPSSPKNGSCTHLRMAISTSSVPQQASRGAEVGPRKCRKKS